MTTLALTDASISINSVDLSDHGNNVSLEYNAEVLDETAFGDDTRSRKGGLKDWSVDVTFHQDFAAAEVDATLFPIVGTTVPIIIKAVNDTTTATNPAYTGTGLVTSYTPFSNGVGDLASASVSIVAAGTLSRATS